MTLKIAPILVLLVFGSAMYGLQLFLPFGSFDFFAREYVALGCYAIAMIVGMLAIAHFIRRKTSIDPLHPEKAKVLVTGGVYRVSRNPMYLAMLLVLVGWAVSLGNAFNSALIIGFVRYMNHFQIKPEERVLVRSFGEEYQRYRVKVRKWF